jgi:hypothetical protein
MLSELLDSETWRHLHPAIHRGHEVYGHPHRPAVPLLPLSLTSDEKPTCKSSDV